MIAIPFGPTRRDLRLRRDHSARFLPWLFALMVYVAGLCGVGLLVLEDALQSEDQSIATSLTLQVPAEISDARLGSVLALLKQTSGIASVHLLEPKETVRLLEPWLGPSAPFDELPVPRLIDLSVDTAAGGLDLTVLRQKIAVVAPGARLDDHRPGAAATRGMVRRIEALLGAGIAVTLGLVAVAAILAVRTALVVQQEAVELMHLLGAGDSTVAGQFALRSLGLALLGGAVGAAAALFTVAALRGTGQLTQLPVSNAATGIGDWRIWGILVGTTLVAGVIAMGSAQLTVLRRLARLP